MDKETEAQLTAIRRQLATLCEEMQFLRKHRNVLSGTPILEFDEVCSLLRQSARSVRRLRETGQLVGFTFGRRRFLRHDRGAILHRAHDIGPESAEANESQSRESR